MEGRTVREVTMGLYQVWLRQGSSPPSRLSPEQHVEELFKLADQLLADLPPGPTAREILEEDRNRLERR